MWKEIQDMIERALFRCGYFDTAKTFITYRFLHKMQREQLGGLYSGNTYVDCKQTVEEYIGQSDWRIAANSNTTYSNAGLINNTAGKVIANYWLDQVYSAREGAAHREGDYHIHDLDCLTGYCAGWSLRNLLNEGFNGVRSRVNSRPPRHFREALGQMANFLGILQSRMGRTQALASFDTFLAPYAFKDQADFTRIKKDIRSLRLQPERASRWGQSPFTNVTIDWTVPRDLRDQAPFSGGEHLFEGVEDPGPALPGAGTRREQADRADLQAFPEGNEPDQQGLLRGAHGRGQHGTALHLPHPHRQHHGRL